MKLGRSLFLSFSLLAATLVGPGACGTDGLVGGSCKRGLSLCNGQCIDLKSDEGNCGRCGNRCDGSIACINGFCGGGGEGWGGDGWGGDSGSGNHGQYAGNAGTDSDAGDGGSGGFNEFDVVYPLGGAGPDPCSPPYKTAEHCGSCETVCQNATPVCGLANSGTYECQPRCFAPEVNCYNSCVELDSDSDNCGKCGNVCPSGICYESKCVGEQAGHLVSVCTNLREATQYSQATTLLGNAVFLTTQEPAKILAFAEYTDEATLSRARATLDWAAQARGRTYRILTSSDPDYVTSHLQKANFDVFLIYDQKNAPAGTLGTYGNLWTDAVDVFSREGGVIVALDGNTGQREMSDLLSNAAILQTSGQTSVSREQVYVRDFGDVMGANIVSPFLAPRDSCVFTGATAADANSSWIVTDNPADPAERRPLAVHRFVNIE